MKTHLKKRYIIEIIVTWIIALLFCSFVIYDCFFKKPKEYPNWKDGFKTHHSEEYFSTPIEKDNKNGNNNRIK